MSKGPNITPRGSGREAAQALPSGVHAWNKTCGRCGTSFDAGGWRRLTVVGNLDRAEIQAHLIVPAPERIELRACSCCKAVMAARPPATNE